MILVKTTQFSSGLAGDIIRSGEWEEYDTSSMLEVLSSLGIELKATEKYSFIRHIQRNPSADVFRGHTMYSFTYRGAFPDFEGV